MGSMLWCKEQAFCVRNSTKDLLYELSIEVAQRANPVACQRLKDDLRLAGCYEVSGVGFDLQAFADAFGTGAAWQEAVTQHFDAVEELCGNPECLHLMTKVLDWACFLLEGGRCNDATGDHPDVYQLPERPGDAGKPKA